MKNIIICCDGTWNTTDQQDQGVLSPTNVVQLYNSLADLDSNGIAQHKYYHPGVGTDGTKWDKLINGGTGEGLDKNIKSAYRELCEYYEPEDKIFLFGFSRGAYTVRSLAGLVHHSGLLDIKGLNETEIWDRIDRVFKQGYRKKIETQDTWISLGWKLKTNYSTPVPIWFIGVWETVGSLGIPDYFGLLSLLDSVENYTFHDTELSPIITHARQALALDEMRASFQPTLWTNPNANTKQVWFTGVHSDVGGGYKDHGLSHITLKWMIDEAKHLDLAINPKFEQQITPFFQDTLHNSYTGIFATFPSLPRSSPQLENIIAIHDSVRERAENPPIKQSPYKSLRTLPCSIDIYALNPWNQTGIWLEKGKTYSFTASGEWTDSSIKCGPAGTRDGDFQIAEMIQVAGSLLGKAEDLFKKLTGNHSIDFKFTKRHQTFNWFSLVGAIANGKVDSQGHWIPHETFLIGDGCKYTPKQSGYLYAYANDAWNCYENNRGRVRLQIE